MSLDGLRSQSGINKKFIKNWKPVEWAVLRQLPSEHQWFPDVRMGEVTDGWAAYPLRPPHLPPHPSEKSFTSVDLSVMP